jgi:Protein of unknown function (DUF2771)
VPRTASATATAASDRTARPLARHARGSLALAALACAGAAVAGCAAAPPPEVTFYSAGKAMRTGPAQYCDRQGDQCRSDPASGANLRVPPGKPLQISVPSEVGNAAWQVVFRYRAPSGERTEARSAVFGPGARLAYTLTLPGPGDQLETAEVQKFGGLASGPEGLEYLIGATWVLSVDDRG